MNLDPDKLVVLFVIALLVLGPKRLPEVARTAGRWMAEVRKYTSAIQGELHGVLGEPLKQTTALRDEFRSALAEPRSALAEPLAALEAGAGEVRTSARIRQRLEAEMHAAATVLCRLPATACRGAPRSRRRATSRRPPPRAGTSGP